MPTKLNSAGKQQEYIPKGNGDASGEYGNSKGSNKHYAKPNVISNRKNVLENKVFYHGSPTKNIKSFDEKKAGENVYVDEAGIFFTDNKDFADEFSYERLEGSSFLTNRKGKKGSVYEAELEMTNPLDFNNLTKEQIQDITENYIKDNGFEKKDNQRWLKEALDHHNPQLAKMYIDFDKLSKSGKYDGYIADLGGQYKGSNEYVIFKGNQAKIKKEHTDKTQANVIDDDYTKKYDNLDW